MKRWLCAGILLSLAGAALAQAPFTIVRPADGAKVREKIRVLIPKNSIPKGGYVGIFLDSKFVEAVVPNLVGRYYEYILDSKGRAIPDGKHVLEAVLYVDYSDEPRIVDRSSIELNVSNKANIPIPDEGIRLRYKFRPGAEWTYSLMQRVALSTISARQSALGGKAAELPLDFEKVRMSYSVENAYGNGDGLIRMQALPLKGKKYAMLTPSGSIQPELFWETDMHPIYMRLTNTGMEVFGSVPEFIPFEGVSSVDRVDLYANYPLPTLPNKPVRPGDVWQTRFQMGKFDLENMTNQTSVIESYPARGEFVGLEWEMGHPCAKIKHSIAAGTRPQIAGRLGGNRAALDETVWFALDSGNIIKVVRMQTVDTVIAGSAAPAAGGARPGGAAAPGGTPRGAGAPGRGGAGPSRGRGGGGGAGDTGVGFQTPGLGATPLKQGTSKGGGGGGQTAGSGRLNGQRTGVAGQIPAGAQFQRLAIQQIFVLDQ